MISVMNTFEDLKVYVQSMIDFTKAEMDAAAEDSLEFYLAAGGHNAWILIFARMTALEAEEYALDGATTLGDNDPRPAA